MPRHVPHERGREAITRQPGETESTREFSQNPDGAMGVRVVTAWQSTPERVALRVDVSERSL